VLRVSILTAILTAPAGTVATEQSPAPPAATPPGSQSTTQDEVTVTAQHGELARKVSKFVDAIALRENFDEGFPRWQASVCPLVLGLREQEGGLILQRVS
jgi:hypothetical protein